MKTRCLIVNLFIPELIHPRVRVMWCVEKCFKKTKTQRAQAETPQASVSMLKFKFMMIQQEKHRRGLDCLKEVIRKKQPMT